jgi:hypothetical protein
MAAFAASAASLAGEDLEQLKEQIATRLLQLMARGFIL